MNIGLRNLLLALLGCGALVACPPTPPPPSPTVVIPETTKVVTGATQTALETVAPNALTFNGTQTFKTGDVVVSAPTASAPNGFLRKVVSSQVQNGKTVLTTAPATLRDAISKGKIQDTRTLTNGDIEAANLTSGVSLASRAAPDNPTFKFEKVLYDKDDSSATTEDQVILSGYLDFALTTRFDWDLDVFPADFDFIAEVKFIQSSNLKLKGKVSFDFNKTIQVGQFRFRPFTITAGPVPVVIRPVIKLAIGVRGSASGEVDVSVTQVMTVTAGAKFDEEWQNLSDFGNTFLLDSSKINAAVNAEAFANATFELLLYESVGLFVRPEVFVAFDAQFPRKPFWKLDGGFGVDIGIEIDKWGIEKAYATRIYETRFPIASSTNSPPKITTFALPPTGNLGRPTFFSSVATDFEDGANLTYTWASSNPADGAIPAGKDTSKTFTTTGSRIITLTVRDSDGEAVSESKSVNITNTAPNVTISNPNENSVIYRSLTYDFLARAADINEVGEAVPCANVVWTSSNNNDTLGNGCQLSATFSTTGIRTITVRATDSQGEQNSKNVTINVLPTPANLPPRAATILSPITSTTIPNGGLLTLTAQPTTDPEGGTVTYNWFLAKQNVGESSFGPNVAVTPNAQNQVNVNTALGLECFQNSFNINVRVTLVVSDPQGNTRDASVIPQSYSCVP